MLSCSKDAKDAFAFLVKYLATFSKDEASTPEAKEGAVRAAVDYIKTPDAFQVSRTNNCCQFRFCGFKGCALSFVPWRVNGSSAKAGFRLGEDVTSRSL